MANAIAEGLASANTQDDAKPAIHGSMSQRSNSIMHFECREKVMPTRIAADKVKLKRAYDQPAPGDGTRVLVDRLWPRGIKKEAAQIDRWLKDIGPSTELRKWFGHDPERWTEFRRRYKAELSQHPEQLSELRKVARDGPLTLVYAAHDELHNNAVVVRELLTGAV